MARPFSNSKNDAVSRKRRIPVSAMIVVLSAVALHCIHKAYNRNSNGRNKASSGPESYKINKSNMTLLKFGTYWLPCDMFATRAKLDEIQKFHIRFDDILVASFPKSGTTWLQEIIYLIMNDVDIQKARESTIEERFPFMEFVYPGLKALAKLEGPRLMKTHVPVEFLPDGFKNGKGKVIYIARNPKDVSVSYYFFMKFFPVTEYVGEFTDFYQNFIEGKVGYGPWTAHLTGYWQNRKSTNFLFLTYEDLQTKPKETIRNIAAFLGKPQLSEQKIDRIIEHCSFSKMKDNPKVNYSWWKDTGISVPDADFMRKGQVGDWINYYSTDMSEEVDELMVKPMLQIGLAIDQNSKH